MSHLCTNVFIVSFPLCEQQLGSDVSRPVLVQVAESAYRFSLGSVAGGKSHAPLAPCILHPTTHLLACVYTCPPTLCCSHEKTVRERTMVPLLPFPLLTRALVAPLLKEKLPRFLFLSLSFARSTIPLLRSVLPLASLCALGKPSCVDSFVPV